MMASSQSDVEKTHWSYKLHPGDLVFWTYQGRKVQRISTPRSAIMLVLSNTPGDDNYWVMWHERNCYGAMFKCEIFKLWRHWPDRDEVIVMRNGACLF